MDKGRVWRFLYSCARVLFPHDYSCCPFPHNYTTSNSPYSGGARILNWGGGGGEGYPGEKTQFGGQMLKAKYFFFLKSSLPGWEAQRHCCNTLFVAVLNGKLSKPGSTLIFQQELREYPLQVTTHHRHTPPPINLLWKELWKIMKQMSKTLNSTIYTPILNKRGSFEVPDPRKSCKKASLSRPSLAPFTVHKPWCKECPLTKRLNWIIAHNYGEPKCLFSKSSFSWEGKILEPDIVWHNML